VPDNEHEEADKDLQDPVTRAEHEAAEIVARARRQAEAIVAEANGKAGKPTINPLAALGDNAEEIIGQVRKLIAKQRTFQAEREEMIAQIETLKSERDELVQRLTDAVERMEELAQLADATQNRGSGSAPPDPTPPPPPMRSYDPDQEDTSLAARLRHAEEAEAAAAEAARLLDNAEAEVGRASRGEVEAPEPELNPHPAPEQIREETFEEDFEEGFEERIESNAILMNNDGRSFYDRHSAKLPRLEGDGGRSVLSAIGDMRPDSDPKSRKGRRRKK